MYIDCCKYLRTCTVEPDVDHRADGVAGSYTLQAHLMKRVYELVNLVETKTKRPLRSQKRVPSLPLVRTAINSTIADTIRCPPGVMLGVVKDAEVPLD